MSRVKINFPEVKPILTAVIPIRITEINYGGHAGNDALLGILHEARVQLLASGGFTEMNVGGCGVIMADVMIAYKREAFYGDVLHIALFVTELSGSSFSILYRVQTNVAGQVTDILHAKTGMVCFDYSTRRVVPIPDKFRNWCQAQNR